MGFLTNSPAKASKGMKSYKHKPTFTTKKMYGQHAHFPYTFLFYTFLTMLYQKSGNLPDGYTVVL